MGRRRRFNSRPSELDILTTSLGNALSCRSRILNPWKFNSIHHFYRYAFTPQEWEAYKLLRERERDKKHQYDSLFRYGNVVSIKVKDIAIEHEDWIPDYIKIVIPNISICHETILPSQLPDKNRLALKKWLDRERLLHKHYHLTLLIVEQLKNECHTLGRVIRILPSLVAYASDTGKADLNNKINQSPLYSEYKDLVATRQKMYQWCNELILSTVLLTKPEKNENAEDPIVGFSMVADTTSVTSHKYWDNDLHLK